MRYLDCYGRSRRDAVLSRASRIHSSDHDQASSDIQNDGRLLKWQDRRRERLISVGSRLQSVVGVSSFINMRFNRRAHSRSAGCYRIGIVGRHRSSRVDIPNLLWILRNCPLLAAPAFAELPSGRHDSRQLMNKERVRDSGIPSSAHMKVNAANVRPARPYNKPRS